MYGTLGTHACVPRVPTWVPWVHLAAVYPAAPLPGTLAGMQRGARTDAWAQAGRAGTGRPGWAARPAGPAGPGRTGRTGRPVRPVAHPGGDRIGPGLPYLSQS